MRLIDADALLNRFNTEIPIRPVSLTYDMGTVLKAIMDSPTVDAEPVRHGRWINYPECLGYEGAYHDEHIVCSACNSVWNIIDNDADRFDYCPNCGAKMDEKFVGGESDANVEEHA